MTYTALGKIAVTRNNYSEAETYLKKAILLGPQKPDPICIWGRCISTRAVSRRRKLLFVECIRLTTDVSRNRYQVQKAHYLLGRILMKKGQQDAAHTEMDIARELANKTLAQDKSKLAGLMDTSGPGCSGICNGGQASPSPVAITADPLACQGRSAKRVKSDSPWLTAITIWVLSRQQMATTRAQSPTSNMPPVWNPSLEGLDYNWGRAAFAGSQFADAIMPLSRYLKSHPDDTGGSQRAGPQPVYDWTTTRVALRRCSP